MNNVTSRLAYLFNRYLDKTATPEEREEFFSMVHAEANSEMFGTLVNDALEKDHAVPDLTAIKAGAILASILQADRETDRTREIHKRTFPKWIYAAAAIFAVMATGLAFLYLQEQKTIAHTAQQEPGIQNALPGYNRATLVLANGSALPLDSTGRQVVRQGNVTITRGGGHLHYTGTNNIQEVAFNTLITPKGGQFRITLPDHTEVWLNAASTLRYPITFAGNERTVELTGEAYFEVAKDPRKPFYVKTGTTTVKVMGTHFNVMAYENEAAIKTTLLEGVVAVSTAKGTQMLTPGDQAIVDTLTAGIEVHSTDVAEAVAWKDGYFLFKGANLPVMARQFERWYDIEIVLEKPRKAYEFVGKIPRTARLSSVLKLLEVNNIPYTFGHNRLIIQP